MNPSDFLINPSSSVFNKSEYETIAANIMVILKRTGNAFRKLSWREYKKERIKDGNFTESEKIFFNSVVGYCKSQKSAKSFSPVWANKFNEAIK